MDFKPFLPVFYSHEMGLTAFGKLRATDFGHAVNIAVFRNECLIADRFLVSVISLEIMYFSVSSVQVKYQTVDNKEIR